MRTIGKLMYLLGIGAGIWAFSLAVQGEEGFVVLSAFVVAATFVYFGGQLYHLNRNGG